MSVVRGAVGLVAAGFIALTTGCASPQQAEVDGYEPVASIADVESLPIFEGPSGLRTSWDSLVAACSRADVVFIGEMHGHPVGLEAAARLYEQAARRKPNTAALSMEFLERDEQAALDDYLSGITDAAGFEQATGRTASNYPIGHRAMVEVARELAQPVFAANAPRRYVRLARTDGFERLAGLTAEQRRLFVIPDELSGGAYRERFFGLMSAMAGHSPDEGEVRTPAEIEAAAARAEAMVLSFYRAQNVWDATMAAVVADALDAGRAPIFHVVGQFHVDHEGGLAERVKAMQPGAEVIVVSMSTEQGPARPDSDAGRADWIIHVGPAPR